MVEISNLNNGTLGTATGTTLLAGVPSTGTLGVPGTLYSVSQIFSAGLEAQSSIGTTAVAGSDLIPLSHGGSVYLASVSNVLSAGGPSLVVSAGTVSVSGVGTLNFTGAVVSASGTGTANVTISSVSLPASAPLLSTNSGGTAVSLGLGPNLVSSGGSLGVAVPASEPLLGSTAGGSFSGVALGSGLALSGGTLSATGTSYVAGIDISISGNTISLAAPASAALLSTNAGGSLSALVLGSGLTESGGTINTVSSGGIELTDGTHTLTGVTEIVVNGGVISGTSPTGTITISASGGGNPPTWTRPRLSAFTQRGTAAGSTLTTLSEPFGAAGPVKLSILGTGSDPFICALAEATTANTEMLFTCSFTVAAFQTGGGNYWRYGALLEDSSGILYAINFENSNGTYVIEEVSYTSYTAYGTEVTTFTLYPNIVNLWIRFYVNLTGTPSIHVMMSNDGISWSELLVTTTPPSSFNMASIAYAAVYGDNGSVWRVEASYNHFDIQYGTGNSLNRYAAVNPL